MPPIPLPLRNALAHLAIRGLRQADAQDAIAWLGDPDRPPTPAAAAILAELHLVDADARQLSAMYAEHATHVRAHATAARAAIARLAGSAPAPDALNEALREARALWEVGLFFEVHEVLEPIWQRASGSARQALQGLIQIAVAFHHVRHGNVRGARKLLTDGRERLMAVGDALAALDADALLAGTATWVDALAAGTPPDGPIPSLPLRTPAPGPGTARARR